MLIQPIIAAINWFLGFHSALPFAIRAFLQLSFTLFAFSTTIVLVQHSR